MIEVGREGEMKECSLSEKYSIVNQWLSSRYPKGIPSFETKERNIDVLFQLVLINERKTALQIESNRLLLQFLDQFKSESNRIQQILEELGISNHSFSSSLQTVVHSLSSAALELNLKNTETSSFYFGIQSVQEEQFKLSDEYKNELKKNKHWKEQILSAQLCLQHLQKTLLYASQSKEKRKETMQKQMDNLEYLEDKGKEYDKQLSQLKQLLGQSGVEQSVLHSSLVQLKNHLDSIQKQVESNNKTLTAYNSLPADISLAKIQIADAQKRLDLLDEKLNYAVNQFV